MVPPCILLAWWLILGTEVPVEVVGVTRLGPGRSVEFAAGEGEDRLALVGAQVAVEQAQIGRCAQVRLDLVGAELLEESAGKPRPERIDDRAGRSVIVRRRRAQPDVG